MCFDEHPKQLTKQVEEPRPAEPGTVAREDYQCERNGTKNLFLAFEPIAGWRAVRVKDRRTTEDWVQFIQHLVDQHLVLLSVLPSGSFLDDLVAFAVDTGYRRVRFGATKPLVAVFSTRQED